MMQVALLVGDTSTGVAALVDWSVTEAESESQALSARHAAASIINKRVAGMLPFQCDRYLSLR